MIFPYTHYPADFYYLAADGLPASDRGDDEFVTTDGNHLGGGPREHFVADFLFLTAFDKGTRICPCVLSLM